MKPIWRNSIIFLTISAFLFFILPYQLFTQNNMGQMMGIVYKKDVKTPYKDCRVVLISLEKDKNKRKEYKSNPTDKDGKYEIQNVPPGVYKVGIIRKGGNKSRKTLTVVNIIGGKTLDRSFFYKPKKPLLGYLNCFIAVIFFGIFIVV